MAGKKIQAQLTPEEKLQQALVPEAEQPYKVPANWCWTRLGNVTNIIMGQSPNGGSITENEKDTPLIGGAADMGEKYPEIKRYTNKPTKISSDEDLIICVRATLGKPIFSDGRYCLGRGVAAIRPLVGSRKLYKYFFLNFEQYLFDNATGTTFAQVNSNILQKMPLALPPLAEQQRIVERIESLFAKLDEAKENLQNVLDGFETRKAAILHKAFNGELTANWRKQHGLTMDSWEEKTLGCTNIDIIDGDRGSNYPKKEEFTLNGYCVFLNTKNVTNQGFNFARVEYITKEKDELLRKGKLQRGDIVLTTRGTIGNIAFYDNNVPFDNMRINSGMVIYRNGKEFYKPFLVHLYKSRFITKQIEALQTGSAQPQLPIKIMKNIKLIIPPFDEQTEIVRIIDNLLAKEQQAYSVAQNAITKIELIKKSILARAFRGQLATNNPADEPAVELLKRVL